MTLNGRDIFLIKNKKERYDSPGKAISEKIQDDAWSKAEARSSAPPRPEGESEQQTGLLVRLDDDVKGRFENSAAYKWLIRNAADYGFVLRYPAQENVGGLAFSPNLYRYVGVENAYNMRAYNMTFDEYAAYTDFR